MNYKKTNTINRLERNLDKRIEAIVGGGFDIEVEIERDGDIILVGEDYYKFNDDGVAGTESGSSKKGYRYGNRMPPPSAFSKYTNDKSAQFAIAKSIQKEGIKAKNYTDKINRDRQVEDIIDDILLDYVDQTIDNSKLIK